ncbi:MAG TPA: beta-ketoacyl-ACP synthase II [Thermomicrobiales bacterium]|nr:beta-ketoacyl-ACP synthase II [Thermomicrobiales bacterium]
MSQWGENGRRRVVVTGLGAYTSLAGTAEESWQRALAGESGISRIERWDPANFELPVGIGGEIKATPELPWLDSREARNIARFARYAVVAAAEAMGDAGLSAEAANYDPVRAGAIVGTAAGGMDVIAETTRTFDARGYRRISPFFMVSFPHNMGTYHVAQAFRLLGPSSAVSTACATGAQAIADAAEFIRRDQADVMLAGGAEHAVFPLFIASFVVQKAATTRPGDPAEASRPFDGEREGFVIGDGAGMLILEELEHARARGATIYAELLGTGSSNDGYHPIAPEPEGRGAAHAIGMALADAGIGPEQIDYVNAHAASTPLGDAAETAAIKRALGEEHARQIPISSTKSMIGHTMGAAGAIEAIMTVLSIRDNRVHPTINQQTPDPACDLDYVANESRQVEVNIALKNSFGLGGQNAALIFGKWVG